jgi:STE24 endopeptidase
MPERRRLLPAVALAAGVLLWILAAKLLWDSTATPPVSLPDLDPHRFFDDAFLDRAAGYERFLSILWLLSVVVLVAVLVIYAQRGQRLIRESAAGRVGTGMLLAMLGFAVVWLAEAPFGLVALWWERRHDVSHQAYLPYLVESFLGLGSQFVFLCVGIGITMGLAGVLRRWWWLAAVPVFVALALLFTFVSPYLIPDTSPVDDPGLSAEARAIERTQGVEPARLEVQDIHDFTAPNAMTTGLGLSRTVILWDTLLDDGFDRSEVRFVLAHEIGHLAHHDVIKGVGWLALVLLPTLGLIALATRRRGGLARPEAVPIALLVMVVLQLATAPLLNVVSRRQEAAADWAALNATHEPASDRGAMRQLAKRSLSDPDPSTWDYVLLQTHPTIMQRIALAEAWESQRP